MGRKGACVRRVGREMSEVGVVTVFHRTLLQTPTSPTTPMGPSRFPPRCTPPPPRRGCARHPHPPLPLGGRRHAVHPIGPWVGRTTERGHTQHRPRTLAHLSPGAGTDALCHTRTHPPPGSPPGAINREIHPGEMNARTRTHDMNGRRVARSRVKVRVTPSRDVRRDVSTDLTWGRDVSGMRALRSCVR
jgi:hypothetical protein